MALVYQSINRFNHHSYVGVTIRTLRTRQYGHFNDARRAGIDPRRRLYPFHAAIRKYGKDAFDWIILADGLSLEEALAEEIAFIAALRPEYNASKGGDWRSLTRAERQAIHRKRSRASYLQKCGVKPIITATKLPTISPPEYVEGEVENWRSVVGYEGFYEVSDHAHVRSCKRRVWHYASKTGTMLRQGRPMAPRPMADGRMFVNLYNGTKKVWAASVAIMVAEAFIRPRAKNENVLRRDGNPLNDLPSNLFWGTEQERADNRGRAKRTAVGSRHYFARITEDDVREIRRLRGIVTQRELKQRYGISNISAIQLGKSWAHVE